MTKEQFVLPRILAKELLLMEVEMQHMQRRPKVSEIHMPNVTLNMILMDPDYAGDNFIFHLTFIVIS